MKKRLPGLPSSRIPCPHCDGPTHTRSSRRVSVLGEPYASQAIRACLDPECGFTFGIAVEVTHGISPSARPNPQVTLRMSPPRTWHANDNPIAGLEVPAAANDDCALTEATG